MNSATIIDVLPGQVAPDDYLKLVSSKCKTAFGFAGREGGKIKTECLSKVPPLSELKELCEAFKDEHLIMYFGDLPKAVLPDDIQPWSLSDGKDPPNHWLVMFYEGNFEAYAGLNGDHTAEYCVSDEIIFPRLNKAFEAADSDIGKFKQQLLSSTVQKSLCNSFDDRGVFIFMLEEGDPISFGKNDIGGEFPWGKVSNTHGYTIASSSPVKTAVTNGLNFLRGRATSEPVTPAPDKQDAPAPSAPHPDAPAEKPANTEGLTEVFPPPKLQKGKARNLWLRVFNKGKLPENHESAKCSVWVESDLVALAKKSISSKGDVEFLAKEVHAIRKARGDDVSGQMVEAQTELEAEATSEAEKAREILVGKEEKPVTSRSTVREPAAGSRKDNEYLPIMTDKDKEDQMVKLSKMLAKEKRPTPLQVQQLEAKWPTYSESSGITFNEMLFITVKELMELWNNKPAVMAFVEMRRNFIDKSGLNLEELAKSMGKKEEPAKVEEKKAASSGGLSFLRGKSAA